MSHRAPGDSDGNANRGQDHALPDDHIADRRRLGSEGHADSEFLCSLLYRIAHEAINPDCGYKESGSPKDGEQQHVETLSRSAEDHDFTHAADMRDRQTSTRLAQRNRNGLA